MDTINLERSTQISLKRLLPRIQMHLTPQIAAHPEAWKTFLRRLEENFGVLFYLYYHLYAGQYDFFFHLEDLLTVIATYWFERPTDLKALDTQREQEPLWFQSHHMLGGVCYVDLFAGDLEGIRAKIPYFKELGLTYLHLMPLFKMPEGENDGGYAVSSYREVHPPLGTMDQLRDLSHELRQNGISLVLDLVFNHTSDEHEWAIRARAGDLEAQEYYRLFPNRRIPDVYERNVREIFPDEHPGAFTSLSHWSNLTHSPSTVVRPANAESGEEIGWVWTTFHSYQWDLNYANPAVFNRMVEEMLFLANTGVEVIRLDAVAFIWKQLGTSCENLPEAHQLIQAFNSVSRIAAPALLFKSEAIVHPDEIVKYISPGECQLSYNPLLMALLWNTLATRDVPMLRQALTERFKLDPQCTWVNYVRCHDDIGWTFSDEDAARLGINGSDHRRFLNAFYTGRFEGSFARGLPFQENPKTGDCRISGTCASLAGLEKALKEETGVEVELAIRRILLIHGVILTISGIPLIYLNDEIGTLNDYDYRDNPAKAHDSRWSHRPFADPKRYEMRNDPTTVEGRIYQGLRQLITLRQEHKAFSGNEMDVMDTGCNQVLGYSRTFDGQRTLVFANFSEREQTIPANLLRLYGLNYNFTNLLSGAVIPFGELKLAPYEFVCLK